MHSDAFLGDILRPSTEDVHFHSLRSDTRGTCLPCLVQVLFLMLDNLRLSNSHTFDLAPVPEAAFLFGSRCTWRSTRRTHRFGTNAPRDSPSAFWHGTLQYRCRESVWMDSFRSPLSSNCDTFCSAFCQAIETLAAFSHRTVSTKFRTLARYSTALAVLGFSRTARGFLVYNGRIRTLSQTVRVRGRCLSVA